MKEAKHCEKETLQQAKQCEKETLQQVKQQEKAQKLEVTREGFCFDSKLKWVKAHT